MRILRILPLLYALITYAYSQVAPSYQPHSLIHPNIKLPATQLVVEGDNVYIDFTENAQISILPDGAIYRLVMQFTEIKSGHLSITEWQVPENAMFFIFNDSNAYTGPYLSKSGKEFVSGRFISESLTLEYFVPINANFTGNFIIDRILPDYVVSSFQETDIHTVRINLNRERPKIMVTGYWPPTNEMVRHFSQDIELNPEGWQGENWEGLGYDVVSFFPQFDPADCNNCGQGYGDLEVDYQDFSQDFWPIVMQVKPVGIITFSRGYIDLSWEIENRLVNRTNWIPDYSEPFLPTPNPPDDTVNNYHIRYTSLPVNDIINAIDHADLGLNPYLDNTNAGMFLSEFSGYHGVWYKEKYEEDIEIPCFSGGHIHVGGLVDWDTAKEAAEVTIRTLINYVDQFTGLPGDCNGDGDVNILDVVELVSMILGSVDESIGADLNSDGLVNIQDILILINIILS